MPDEDLVECDHVRKKFKGANYYSYYNAAHKWYYLGEQRPDEVMLLKMFDSDGNVKAKSKKALPSPKDPSRTNTGNVKDAPTPHSTTPPQLLSPSRGRA
jgi:hypothetical protein